MTNEEDELRGIDLGNGWMLAPHQCSDEDEAINYEPVTPENVYLKLRAIREFCLKLEEDNKFVNSAWVSGHIMCILKYGDGFQQAQRPAKGSVMSLKSIFDGRFWNWWKRRL